MKIIALQPIRHDQADYAIGAELELSDEQAQALIAVGAAETDDAAAPVKQVTKPVQISKSKAGQKKVAPKAKKADS